MRQITTTLPITTDQNFSATGGTRCDQLGAVVQCKVATGDDDLTAFCCAGRIVRRTFNVDDAGVVHAIGVDANTAAISDDAACINATTVGDFVRCAENNAAADFGDASRNDLAAVANDTGSDFVIRLRRDDDSTVRCLDDFFVFDQRIDRRWRDQQIDFAVGRIDVHGYGLAGGQRDGAGLGQQHAAVQNLRCKQSDVTAQLCFDAAFVDDFTGCTVAIESVVTRHEILIGHRMGGGD
ncbi:hypothetical protein MCEGEM3_01976 [Oxalobacteraceae bacterium]